MAVAATPRRLIDLGFASAIAVLAIVYACSREQVPRLPAGVCAETEGFPVVAAHARIAAVFATIEGPEDVTGWSARTLASELARLGFSETSPHQWSRADATVDVIGPLADDAETVETALNRALDRHDIVYYNGHHFGGALELHARNHPIAILDTCWSAQYYAALAGETALIGNRERAITGSVYGFVDLLEALLARDGRSWSSVLAPINAAAIHRAARRDVYPEPEKYGLVGRCQGQAPAIEP